MTAVVPTRVTGRIEGDFVVFLIGMRMPGAGPGLAGPAHDLSVPGPAGSRRPRGAKRGSPNPTALAMLIAGEMACTHLRASFAAGAG